MFTGRGTYSINGGEPVFIMDGDVLPAGTTNVYFEGSAYDHNLGSSKQFDAYVVSQESPVSLLTVDSELGSPVPAVGEAFYESGSVVTCSVNDVITNGVWYECIGWTGTGSVPASGITNEVVVQLNEGSSIAWAWRTNYWVEVEVVGSGAVSQSSGYYVKDSVVNLSATPDSGWLFLGWGGDVSGFLDTSITINESKSLRATFLDSSINTILLQDDFEDDALNSSVWTGISATYSVSFDEASVGNSLKETNGVMQITMGSSNNGGAYKTSDLLVNDQGEIVITRRTRVSGEIPYFRTYDSIYMTENLMADDGSTLLAWGYYDVGYSVNGFGGYSNLLATAVWNEWFDESITYDPVSGAGTYSINGITPLLISGAALPDGVTNVYLRGGAYSGDNGLDKTFDAFSVVQGEPSNYSLLTVDSSYGAPVPVIGESIYESGSVVTCSVPAVVSVGGWMTPVIRYGCTGWTGTGSVPSSGTTNEVVVTLDESSSITWHWVVLDATVTVNGLIGTGSPASGVSVYEIGSDVPFWVESWARVNGVRWECTGWTGTGSVPASGTNYFAGIITIEENSSITWQWQNLESKLTVVSAYGTPDPAVGETLYPAGTEVVFWAPAPVYSSGTSHVCSGWKIDSWTGSFYTYIDSGTNQLMAFTLDDPYLRLIWTWQTDHQLTVQVEGSGTVSHVSGFYPEGSTQTLVATPAEGWVFDGWDGDASGTGSALVTMTAPKSVTAFFSKPAGIENLSVAQVEGERTVEVTYDVAGTRPLLVDLEIYQGDSNLNAHVYGDTGMVSGTNNVIRWNAGASWNHNVDELTFNLLSEDGLTFYAPYTPGPWAIPKTQITQDYYPGTDGEDGDLQAGMEWPSPRFADNGDGTVTDNMTGLQWGKTASYTSWMNAMSACESSTLAGHDDWRLPNVRELRSLLSDFSRSYPVLELGVFSNFSTGNNYWTSTRFEYNANYAYAVYANYGFTLPLTLGSSYGYLPVRGSSTGVVSIAQTGQTNSFSSGYTSEDGDLQNGQEWPEPRFTDHGDGTATDNLTGLMWCKTQLGMNSWAGALNACNGLMVAGHTDWRLPNINELETLVDYGQKYPNPTLPQGHPFTSFPGGTTVRIWSSSTPSGTDYGYIVDFYNGHIDATSKGYGCYVMACRGGMEIDEEIPEPVGQYPLPQTGQTNSVASSDDGDVQAGIASPSPRFQQITADGIRDNLTGLLWYIRMDNQSNWDYWTYALSNADASGWRLPNVREMLSLMDLGESGPALPEGHPFQNVQTNANYWTSTTYNDSDQYAWQVDMSSGAISLGHKYTSSNMYYAMVSGPVGEPQAYVHKTGQTNSFYADDDGAWQRGYVQTGDRFTDNGNYTISDNRTGLMWLKSIDSCGVMTWAEAVEYCENLNYGGYTDWRLPNARELESLVDYSQGGSAGALPQEHPFTDYDYRYGSGFWSSTTLNSDTGKASYLSLNSGGLYNWPKDLTMKAWPVRAGN